MESEKLKSRVRGGFLFMEGKPEGENRNVFTELGDVYEAEWYALGSRSRTDWRN